MLKKLEKKSSNILIQQELKMSGFESFFGLMRVPKLDYGSNQLKVDQGKLSQKITNMDLDEISETSSMGSRSPIRHGDKKQSGAALTDGLKRTKSTVVKLQRKTTFVNNRSSLKGKKKRQSSVKVQQVGGSQHNLNTNNNNEGD